MEHLPDSMCSCGNSLKPGDLVCDVCGIKRWNTILRWLVFALLGQAAFSTLAVASFLCLFRHQPVAEAILRMNLGYHSKITYVAICLIALFLALACLAMTLQSTLAIVSRPNRKPGYALKFIAGCIVTTVALFPLILWLTASARSDPTFVAAEVPTSTFKPLPDKFKGPFRDAPASQPPCVVGKIVVVNQGAHFDHAGLLRVLRLQRNENDQNEIDDLHFELPDSLRATKPQEVGTLVLLEWKENVVGRYSPGSTVAYRVDCYVTLVDLRRGLVLEKKQFLGEMPLMPKVKPSTGDFYGPLPSEKILEYLRTLPRKPPDNS